MQTEGDGRKYSLRGLATHPKSNPITYITAQPSQSPSLANLCSDVGTHACVTPHTRQYQGSTTDRADGVHRMTADLLRQFRSSCHYVTVLTAEAQSWPCPRLLMQVLCTETVRVVCDAIQTIELAS